MHGGTAGLQPAGLAGVNPRLGIPWEGPGAAGRWDTAPLRGYPGAACAAAGVKQPQPAQMRAGAQGQAGHRPQGVSQSHRPGYHVPSPAAPCHQRAEVPHVVPMTRRCHKHQGCRQLMDMATDCFRAWIHISTPSHGEKQNKPRTPRSPSVQMEQQRLSRGKGQCQSGFSPPWPPLGPPAVLGTLQPGQGAPHDAEQMCMDTPVPSSLETFRKKSLPVPYCPTWQLPSAHLSQALCWGGPLRPQGRYRAVAEAPSQGLGPGSQAAPRAACSCPGLVVRAAGYKSVLCCLVMCLQYEILLSAPSLLPG